MRHRAQTPLYFRGWRAKAIVEQQDLSLNTVYDLPKHWLAEGFDSLADKHRCGVASKVSQAQREQLQTWATADALRARQEHQHNRYKKMARKLIVNKVFEQLFALYFQKILQRFARN